MIAQLLCFFSSEAPTWAQLKRNSWNSKLMLGRTLKKQRIPVRILQRSSRPFTGTLPALLSPSWLPVTQTAKRLTWPSSCTGEFRILPDFSNSYFKQLLLPHPANKGITLCMYLFLRGYGYFPKPPFPHQADPRQQKYSDLPLDGATVHKSLRRDYKFNSQSTRNWN